MRQFFMLFLLTIIFLSFYANSVNYNELKDIERTCQQASPECLAYLEVGLNLTKPHSRQWFRFKQLRLENLFALQKYHQLQKEVNYWAQKKNLPVHFSVDIYIYQAKLLKYEVLNSKDDVLSSDDKVRQIKETLEKASHILNEMNTSFESPIKFIEIANLQLSLKNYEVAKQILLQLEKKYINRDDPIFKQELYGNLGHITRAQGKLQKSIEYSLESLKWTLVTKNNQQIATNNYNVALSYQKAEEYYKAEHYYSESAKYAILADDDRAKENSTLRLIEVIQQQGNITKAKEMLLTLPDFFIKDIQLPHNKALYQQLKESLL